MTSNPDEAPSRHELDIPDQPPEYPAINGVSPRRLNRASDHIVPADWPEVWTKDAHYEFEEYGVTLGINVNFERGAVGPQSWEVWVKEADEWIAGAGTHHESPAAALDHIRQTVETLGS